MEEKIIGKTKTPYIEKALLNIKEFIEEDITDNIRNWNITKNDGYVIATTNKGIDYSIIFNEEKVIYCEKEGVVLKEFNND